MQSFLCLNSLSFVGKVVAIYLESRFHKRGIKELHIEVAFNNRQIDYELKQRSLSSKRRRRWIRSGIL